jgi:nitrogen fixation/metabolism regulation signal transduction histidine kinase
MSTTHSEPRGWQRKKKIVNPNYQLRYTFLLIMLASLEGILVAGGLLTVIFSVIEISPEDHVRLFNLIIGVSVGMILVLGVINSIIGIFLSHRISGSAYRLMQVAKTVSRGDLSPVVMLREKDELQDLKVGFNEMLDGLRGLVREHNHKIDHAVSVVRKLHNPGSRAAEDPQAWQTLLTDLEKIKEPFII